MIKIIVTSFSASETTRVQIDLKIIAFVFPFNFFFVGKKESIRKRKKEY